MNAETLPPIERDPNLSKLQTVLRLIGDTILAASPPLQPWLVTTTKLQGVRVGRTDSYLQHVYPIHSAVSNLTSQTVLRIVRSVERSLFG